MQTLSHKIKKRALTSALLLAVSLTTTVQAREVAGVELAEQITLADAQLQLNGAGVRSKFFMDLYVGSLYLPAASADISSILTAPVAAIRLNITSGMITSDKMHDAIIEGFDDATNGDTSAIQAQIDAFMALFSADIVDGDQFTFATDKATGVTAYKNGVAQATITGEAFRQALLNIWLGDSPAQNSLKEAMLGE